MECWQKFRAWLASGMEAPRIFLMLTIVALFVGAAWLDSNVKLYSYIGIAAFFLVQISLIFLIAILMIRQRKVALRYFLLFTPAFFFGVCLWRWKTLLHDAPMARFGDFAIYFYSAIFTGVVLQCIPLAFPPKPGHRSQTILEQ
jgi:hypothetical protein